MEHQNNLIEKLTIEELTELKRIIKEGMVEKLIENKLEKFKNNNKICPVCNTQIEDNGLTLIFGPTDFRKKATFDAADCLEYFISKIRK
ncbi:MAG: hypothetical protein KJ583_01810 [Nanoarchaeota archaeon]|nr:hypothetical protein [Nanoarchaeota archaeon]MBU1269727.1 hypothetical protein [Nanoarchaeota archaeon]MBU1604028.1 hypothetical protein [Nanoarchaeota archaeon]